MKSLTNYIAGSIRLLYPFPPDNYQETYFEEISSTILTHTPLTYFSKQILKNHRHDDNIVYVEKHNNPSSKTIATLPAPLYIYGTCSSSIDIALTLAKKKMFPIWSSLIVTSQNSGRGQLGKKWISPPGNLYATIRLPLCPLFSKTTASSAIGSLITHTLNTLHIPVFLKWPNDLLISTVIDNKKIWAKVGGILLEEQNDILLAGIGINICSLPNDSFLPVNPTITVAKLPTSQIFYSSKEHILELWVILVKELFLWYTQSKEKITWNTLAERYLAFKHQQVILKDGPHEKDTYKGTLIAINPITGGLCLSIHGEQKTFLSGSLFPLI